MEIVNPGILWGLFALALPILIHFWNQKKATIVPWAAMIWLTENKKLIAKGIQFSDLFLLILRLLAIFIAILFLSQLLLNSFKKNKEKDKVHIIAPNNNLIAQYRFELNEALKKNEEVYWLNKPENAIKELENHSLNEEMTLSDIQFWANQFSEKIKDKKLEFYLPKNVSFNGLATLYLPENSKVWWSSDSNPIKNKALFFNKYLYLNADNQLVISNLKPKLEIISLKRLKVYLDTKNSTHKNQFKASLAALSEIYGLVFEEIENKKTADLILSDAIYFDNNNLSLSNIYNQKVDFKNHFISNYSEIDTHIPEKIIEKIIEKFELGTLEVSKNEEILNSIIKTSHKTKNNFELDINQILVLLFLLIMILERWISIKQNK